MDLPNSHDYADAAYKPQIVNEQDQPQAHQDEQNNGHSNGYTQSATASPMEQDPNSRYNSPSLTYQPQPSSRPGSGMGGPQHQTQHQENRQPQPANKSSVVIKVGMVGDAQIGKTSLMVKYVEGSWDEDYIQTLGMRAGRGLHGNGTSANKTRGKFHGEDHIDTKHRNHVLDMGFRWSA